MSPGGHLMTAVLAAGAGLVLTGSAPLAAGIVAGGFLIDVDHLADYLIVERRRELTPAAFLRHYIGATHDGWSWYSTPTSCAWPLPRSRGGSHLRCYRAISRGRCCTQGSASSQP